jgi:hypothetical protein
LFIRETGLLKNQKLSYYRASYKYASDNDNKPDFIAKNLSSKVFLVTGGACAFIVDSIGRHKKIDYGTEPFI